MTIGDYGLRVCQFWEGTRGHDVTQNTAALLDAIEAAHPFTILSAFVAAPFTSLNPAIAAGWVAGLVEALLRKPQVKDFEQLGEDVTSVRGFWQNKITRILLVVVFANLGSTVGTLIGGVAVATLL